MSELPRLTDEERGWLEKRKTGDITVKQQLAVGEIQTRAVVLKMAEGPDRDAWLARCRDFRAEVDALPDAATVKQQGDLMQRLHTLHVDALAASHG